MEFSQQPLMSRKLIVGQSLAFQAVMSAIRKVAPYDMTVLITGETGTGKEAIANAIQAKSRRAKNTFVKMNCAALPESLLESELFGHERGAFTNAVDRRVGKFEQADHGTLLLDEVGDMTLSTQAKVLRAIQEREFERVGGNTVVKVDLRLIASTNRDLRKMVVNGTFREDLYYRLHVFPIGMPPLRERKEDIPFLAKELLRFSAFKMGKEVKGISPQALNILKDYSWPGNVRELESVIERGIILAEGPELCDGDVEIGWQKAPTSAEPEHLVNLPPEGASLDDIDREAVLIALKRTGWSLTKAARLLQVPRDGIRYRCKKYGIKPDPRSAVRWGHWKEKE